MQLAPRPNSGWSKAAAAASTSSVASLTLDVRRFALNHPTPSNDELTGDVRIFLDSGRVEDYAEFLPLGMVWGVTTNPTILERAGQPCTYQSIKDLAAKAFSWGAKEFMAQAWGGDVGTMVEHGLQIASIDPRVVVKVPVTAAGLEAATFLRAQGVRICTTAVYAPHQVVSSVAVAAEYAGISPPFPERAREGEHTHTQTHHTYTQILARTHTHTHTNTHHAYKQLRVHTHIRKFVL